MKIVVIGLGYVGCVAVAKFAEAGHHVIGVDLRAEKVELINRGMPTVVEPGLEDLLMTGWLAGRVSAATGLADVVADADVYCVCVGTPPGPDGHLNTTAVTRVAEEVRDGLSNGHSSKTLLIRSTVPPGTTAAIQSLFDSEVSVVMNPEFLREGSALKDWDEPGVVVIGSADTHGADVVEALHSHLDARICRVAPASAELIKFLNNSWHALKVSFGNEVGRVCAGLGVGHEELMDVFLSDAKLNVSGRYLRPGMPYGGSCLPKDLGALCALGQQVGESLPMLNAVHESNETHVDWIVSRVCARSPGTVGIAGLAFKKGTDDLRHSPGVTFVRRFRAASVATRIFDPSVDLENVMGANADQVEDILPTLRESYVTDLEQLVEQCDVVVLAHNYLDAVLPLRERFPDTEIVEAFRLNDC